MFGGDSSFRFASLARNLNFKLLDFVVITVGVQKIEWIRRMAEE